jgi:hypothetical protein
MRSGKKKWPILGVRISSQLAAQLACDLFIEVMQVFQLSHETGWLAEAIALEVRVSPPFPPTIYI